MHAHVHTHVRTHAKKKKTEIALEIITFLEYSLKQGQFNRVFDMIGCDTDTPSVLTIQYLNNVCHFFGTFYGERKGTAINKQNREAHGLATNFRNNIICDFPNLAVNLNKRTYM